ncbi:hypothetical protein [Nocardia sp. NPDC006630]|uniref:hypothetical protein n=1 Tax=Nocardia sp. NPDC006630 TaxID=3157181 RepID=UPI0033A30DDF
MEPEYGGQYWAVIVGEHWPRIGPGDWSTLESAVRDGAAALDLTGVEQARRGFDDRVRASVSLQAVKEDMLAQGRRLRELQAVLSAAGDAFHEFAAVVARTRNRILDIVDDAVARIGNAQAGQDNSGGDTTQAEIFGIVQIAAAEVAAVAANARAMIDFEQVPGLVAIAELLGLPFPWHGWGGGAGLGRQPTGQGHRAPGDGGHRWGAGHAPGSTESPHPGAGPAAGWSNPLAVVEGLLHGAGGVGTAGPLGGVLPPDALTSADPISGVAAPGLAPGDAAAGPASGDSSAGPGSGDSGAGLGTGGGSTSADSEARGYGPVGAGSGHDAGGHGGAPVYLPPPDRSMAPDVGDLPGASAPDPGGTPESIPVQPDSPGISGPGGPSAGASAPEGSESSTADGSVLGSPETSEALRDSSGADVSAFAARDSAQSSADRISAAALGPAPIFLASPIDIASAGSSAPITAGGAQSASAQSVSATPGIDARGGAPIQASDSRGVPGSANPSGSGVAAHGPYPPGAVSASGKAAAGPRPAGAIPAAPPPGTDGAAAMIHDVVGAAMAAAAAPGIVMGTGVDGDLMLARTLLGSVLAVVDDSPVAPAWAVSVLRHSGGVSVFLTSNEGRGWLPAGLFLPREISLPWVWEAAQGPPWEGVSDPARVLLEFGLVWGAGTGARISAVASSQTIDAGLRGQLRDVALAEAVGAEAGMNLTAPGPGLIDRLELVSSRRLLERVADVPQELIGRRCADLAWDAHARTARIAGATETFGAVGARTRIMKALRQHRTVSPDWWEELRDADDLLAATAVPLRLDVTAVPLGQLRSESRSAVGEPNALRALLFQRRCNELVHLLAVEPTRQMLRDAVYVHGQLADHPAMAGTGAPASTRPPTITVGP